MKYWILLGFMYLWAFGLKAQQVQWASRVINHSSELTPLQFSIQQLLGKPSILPKGTESPVAWTPSRPRRRREYVKVGFQQPMKIRQVAISESYNPSAVYKIYLYDTTGKEHLLSTLSPGLVSEKGRVLRVFFEETPYKVAAMKVVFKPRAVDGYFSIDAIGISNAHEPIEIKIDLAENLVEGLIAQPLGPYINSMYKELSPLLSSNGKVMYFSRKNHPGNMGGTFDSEDIWYSEWNEKEKQWGKPKNIGFPLNNFGPNYISAIAPDGKSIFALLGNLYGRNGKMTSGLSVSYLTSRGWSYPEKVKVENEYNMSSKANFFLSNNRRILIMSVEREDGQGGRDLYVSFLKNNDEWTEPMNLGPTVNSADEEVSPFLSSDNRTLFFSSSGFKGYGRQDILVAYRLDESWQNWSEVRNLGPTFNTTGDDVFFQAPVKGKYAYFTRELDDGNADIYQVKLPIFDENHHQIVLKGKVQTLQAHEPAGDSVVIIDEKGNMLQKVAIDSADGSYEVQIRLGKRYFVYAEEKDRLSVGYWLDLRDVDRETQEWFQHILMAPVQPNQRLILYHVDFLYGKGLLKTFSSVELQRIVKFLDEHPGVKLEISAFTDELGHDNYDHYLSVRRARAVYKYLLAQGIGKNRLYYRGYGNRKPLTKRQGYGDDLNNRVELRLLLDQ